MARRKQSAVTAIVSQAARVEPLERRMLLSLAPAGAEFLVNTFTTGNQVEPAIGVDADGDFVIAWEGPGQDGSGNGVYAQRYAAAGAAQGGEFRVNTFTPGNQLAPAIAIDADGDFVIVWSSRYQDGFLDGVYAQRYSANGMAQGSEIRVNSTTSLSQSNPSVAMDVAGNFVVAWDSGDQDGSSSGVYAQRYNFAGIAQGSEFRVNTYTTNYQGSASAAMDATGEFVVAWDSYGQDGGDWGVYAQRFDTAGAAQGSEFRVNTYTTGTQASSSVGIDSDGDFVIAWSSQGQNDPAGVSNLFARRYNSAGAAQGGEFAVNTFTTGYQLGAAVVMDADGDFVVSWFGAGSDASDYGVYYRRFSPAGAAQDPVDRQVNTFTPGNQYRPAVGMSADRDFVVAWQSDGRDGNGLGIAAQRFAETQDAAGPIIAGLFVNDRRVLPYTVHPASVSQFVVSFSENLSTAGGATGVNSVLNPANWRVVQSNGGTVANVPITSLTYQFSPATNRFESTLQLPGSFASGNLQIVAYDNIRDLAGNALDGNLDGIPGGGTSLMFGISSLGVHGSDFRINTWTPFLQSIPAVANDADGNFVVVWDSDFQDGDRSGIFAQRHSADGTPLGKEFMVNSHTTLSQFFPDVAMDADGDFVVTWTSDWQDDFGASGIYAQRYNANGEPLGSEFLVNTYTTNFQTNSSIGMNAAGDFVIAWGSQGQDFGTYGVYAKRYTATGVPIGLEFRVNSYTTGFQRTPTIAMDADGDFVVAWDSSSQDGSTDGIYAQRFTAAGLFQGQEFRVNTYTPDRQISASAAMDASGNFAVAWQSTGQDGANEGIYAQRYTATGLAQGSEFRVNTYTTGSQTGASLAMDVNGNLLVAWESFQDGSGHGVYAQRYNAAGVAQGSETKVNAFTTGVQVAPAVAVDPAGEFLVTWVGEGDGDDDLGIYANRVGLGALPRAGTLSAEHDPVSAGDPILLTAIGVADDGPVASVRFHRESNGIEGLQFGAGGDVLLGTDSNGGNGWAIAASTAGLPVGTYTYYAHAVDGEGFAGAPASTTNTVLPDVTPPQVSSSALEFQARQAIAITFSEPLNPATVSASDLSALNLDNSSTPIANSVILSAGNTIATWIFNTPGTFISDGDYSFTLPAGAVSDVSGNPSAAPYNLTGAGIWFLGGDANRDRRVNLNDFNILAANFAQSPRLFSQGDFNYDTLVNLADYNVLAGRFGFALSATVPDGSELPPLRSGMGDEVEDALAELLN